MNNPGSAPCPLRANDPLKPYGVGRSLTPALKGRLYPDYTNSENALRRKLKRRSPGRAPRGSAVWRTYQLKPERIGNRGTQEVKNWMPVLECSAVASAQAIRGVLCAIPIRPRVSTRIIPPWPFRRAFR